MIQFNVWYIFNMVNCSEYMISNVKLKFLNLNQKNIKMAVQTLEQLINGNEEIVEYYRNARELWDEIRNSIYFESVERLAEQLSMSQMTFEHRCGGRWLGQEIMTVVGIGQFYSSEIGFDATIEDALKVKDAFAQSYCSLEVKWHAERTSKIFRLTESRESL